MEKIKVLIVDDQILLAEGIKSVLEMSEDLQVLGTAENGVIALKKMEEQLPDVVLLDIRMPEMNGVVATQEIKKRYPQVKVVILTTFDDSEYILNAINNGASGYLLKDISSEALVDAIKNAYKGDTILPAKIAKKIAETATLVTNDREIKLKKSFGFSSREVEIAMMMCEGFTNRQIATALKLTDGTARNYISVVYEKVGSENRGEAIAKMQEIIALK